MKRILFAAKISKVFKIFSCKLIQDDHLPTLSKEIIAFCLFDCQKNTVMKYHARTRISSKVPLIYTCRTMYNFMPSTLAG